MLWSSLHLPALVAYKQLKGMLLSLESMFKEFHLLHRTPFLLWSSLHLPALVAYKQLKGMLLSLESMFKEFHLLHRTPFLKIKCVNTDEFATFVDQADFAYFLVAVGFFSRFLLVANNVFI